MPRSKFKACEFVRGRGDLRETVFVLSFPPPLPPAQSPFRGGALWGITEEEEKEEEDDEEKRQKRAQFAKPRKGVLPPLNMLPHAMH